MVASRRESRGVSVYSDTTAQLPFVKRMIRKPATEISISYPQVAGSVLREIGTGVHCVGGALAPIHSTAPPPQRVYLEREQDGGIDLPYTTSALASATSAMLVPTAPPTIDDEEITESDLQKEVDRWMA